MDRYHRQTLLPFMGPQGQSQLASARVLLVGCGALGSVIADQLVRAGIGHLTIADRDVVELTNLQRQVLFDEDDARDGTPKAIAAANRLRKVNSSVEIDPRVVDVHAGNIEQLAGVETDGTRVSLILDGTDNVETRYLVNDVAVKHGIPWVYGACVGVDGRVMPIRPGVGPCLRCVFPTPPASGELPTCDTAGVLAPAAAIVASMQVVAGIRLLIGNVPASSELTTMDVWKNRFRTLDAGERRSDCTCCGERRFDFLDRSIEQSAVQLCGRNAVQIRGRGQNTIGLPRLAQRLARVGRVQEREFLVRCELSQEKGVQLTVFGDGRTIVQGTSDLSRARTIVSRYVGL
jgi:molybdopterin/thiamine biosynthesis adenylyltransferase